MKNINVVCYKTGIAKMTTDDLHIDLENNASKLTIDFTDIAEDYPGIGKWVDILMSDGTALRYNLGIDDIVSVDLTYSVTVKGTVIITPFIYDGTDVKFKFVNRNTITIYNQPEAGDSEIAERDDYIFELAGRVGVIEEALPLKADLVDGKVPLDQLPNIVEEVEEYDTLADFPVVGEVGIIYLALDTEKAYLWSGTIYVPMNSISASEIKSLYESNPDTNAFTDALLSKLNGITAGADMKKSEFNVNGTVGKVDKALISDTVLKVPMTYDTAGKFYATVQGYALLVNTVFLLEFPNTEVDLTENVSISLGGISGTYKDLKYNDTLNHLLVKHTAELKCRVDYNGTEWFTDGASLIDYEQVIISRTDSSIAVKPISNGITTLVELQGRSLRQDIVNGDTFESDWILNNAIGSVTDDIYSFTASARFGSLKQTIDLIEGNLYFWSFLVKADSDLIVLGDGVNGIGFHSGSGEYEYITGIATAGAIGSATIQDNRTSDWTQIDVKEVKAYPISNTPYEGKSDEYMLALNLPYFEDELDVVNPSITTVGDSGREGTLTLQSTFRSVGTTVWDRAYQDNGIWYKGENVKLITSVAIGATINDTLITDINLSSSFVATDEVTGDIQEGVYGDVLTLVNTATVKYQTATETPIEIDVDGSLICDTVTTISQTQDLPAQITVSYPVTSKSQIKTNTENIIKTQNEVTKLENTVNPLLTLDYVDVISVNKTIFAGERVTITPASGEISLLVPRLGTKVIPAGALMERQCFRVSVCGYLNSTANSSNTVKITINDGVTYEFINQSNTVPTTAGSNAFVKFEFEFSVFSIIDNVACISLNGNDIVHAGMAFASVSGRSFINECVNVDATEDLELDITYEIGSNGTFQVTGSKIILE